MIGKVRRLRNDMRRLRTVACRVCYHQAWWRLRHHGAHVEAHQGLRST